jgi:hypothetical protein
VSPEISDAAFAQLKLPSYEFADTTPEADDDFRGFRIAAPRRLTAGSLLRIPVSALAKFDDSARMPQPLWDAVTAIVVETPTNRCWVATLMDPDRVPLKRPAPPQEEPPPAAAGPPGEDEIHEVGGSGPASRSAHVDLRSLLALPPTPATYDIHFTYGTWASNSVRVVVERPKEED